MFTLQIRPGHKVSDRSLATLELIAESLTFSGVTGWAIWKGSQALRRG